MKNPTHVVLHGEGGVEIGRTPLIERQARFLAGDLLAPGSVVVVASATVMRGDEALGTSEGFPITMLKADRDTLTVTWVGAWEA